PDLDPALAGFSASGAGAQQDNTSIQPAPDTAPSRGLAPPAAETPEPAAPGTGLAEPADRRWQPSWSAEQHQSGKLSYTQSVVKALGGDPHHFQFTDGLGAPRFNEAHLVPVGGLRAPAAESRPFEISVNP